jgi:hypothetical protein
MYTTPSIDDLLEGVIVSLQNDVLSSVTNARAGATVAMAQAVLQQVRQMLPAYERVLVEEHNEMTDVLRDVAVAVGETAGPEADAIRGRARTLGGRPDYPAPLEMAELMAAHRSLSQGLVDTLRDLDVLQRAGNAAADQALGRIREHLGPRTVRDVEMIVVGAGMVGRG